MNIKDMVQTTVAFEQAAQRMKDNIVAEIIRQLSDVELPNAKRISSSPLIVIVPASAVFSNKWNMSAEYYISETQTKVLIQRIRSKTTLTEIKHFIDTVIENEYIKIDSKNKMPINSAVKAKLIEIAAMLQ